MKLKNLLRYINSKSREIDLFCFQEVAGGYRFKLQYQKSDFNQGNYDNIDLFNEIKESLIQTHKGFLTKSYSDESGCSYVGNATFIRREIQLKEFDNLFMGEDAVIDILVEDHSKVRYNAQILKLSKNQREFTLVNTHMLKYVADKQLASKYFKLLKNTIDKVDNKIVLTGDFNIDKSHTLIKRNFKILKFLNQVFDISNTLNKEEHIIFKNNSKQAGLSVDQFFISKNIEELSLIVDEVNVSDHYPLILNFNL